MPAKLVPAIRTTYDQSAMIRGLTEGWYKQFKTIPKKQSIGVLFSQNALETGGTKSMWNNNIGNVKFAPSKNPEDDNGKEYMMLTNVWEMINGKKIIFNPPDPATWFVSYSNLAEGIAEHLDYLKNKRYKAAWVAVEAGDYVQFAHILKINYYYTASEADYIKGMQTWFNKFMKDKTFDKVVEELTNQKIPTLPDLSTSKIDIKPTGIFDIIKNIFNRTT